MFRYNVATISIVQAPEYAVIQEHTAMTLDTAAAMLQNIVVEGQQTPVSTWNLRAVETAQHAHQLIQSACVKMGLELLFAAPLVIIKCVVIYAVPKITKTVHAAAQVVVMHHTGAMAMKAAFTTTPLAVGGQVITITTM